MAKEQLVDMEIRKFTIFVVVIFALLVSACAQAGSQAGAVGTVFPGDTATAAANQAQKFLSDSLGVDVGQVKIVSVNSVKWPDACLGLPQADEACAQVVTPGFNISLDVNGKTYELHTDEQGVNIRQAP